MRFEVLITEFWLPLLIAAVASYLLGSFNFAIIVTKSRTHTDIRDYGSGNAGATNVLRSQGKVAAALTTLGDLGKSMLSVFLGGMLVLWMGQGFFDAQTEGVELIKDQVNLVGRYVAGMFCILGHLYPLYFGFRGGKGVMTTLGMMLVLDWRVALISLSAFILVVILCKMVSLGSIVAGLVMVATTFIFRQYVDEMPTSVVTMCTVFAGLIVGMLIIKHIPNIKRILAGTESKIGDKKKDNV